MRRHVTGIVLGWVLIAGCGAEPEVTGAAPGAPGASEQALLPLISCTGTAASHFEPPLKNERQDVFASATGALTLCPLSGGLTATFAPRAGPIKNASCLDTLLFSSGTLRLTWRGPGETSAGESEIVFSSIVTGVEDVATIVTDTGTVTAGKFVGAKMVRVTTYANNILALQCVTPEGLSDLNGPMTFVLTPPLL